MFSFLLRLKCFDSRHSTRLKSIRVLLSCRRKRGEKGEVVETIEDVIVRRLTTERIEELKKLLRDTQEQYRHVHTLKKAL